VVYYLYKDLFVSRNEKRGENYTLLSVTALTNEKKENLGFLVFWVFWVLGSSGLGLGLGLDLGLGLGLDFEV
jgi:hypothetical protein